MWDIFSRIAAGMSNSEIAASLFLSEGTVKVHVGRILAKLGLRDRVQAVVLAYESGLITPGTPSPRPPVDVRMDRYALAAGVVDWVCQYSAYRVIT